MTLREHNITPHYYYAIIIPNEYLRLNASNNLTHNILNLHKLER